MNSKDWFRDLSVHLKVGEHQVAKCRTLQSEVLNELRIALRCDEECDAVCRTLLSFLGLNCASKEQLQLLQITSKDEDSVAYSLVLDFCLKTDGILVRGVKNNLIGAENWLQFLTECRRNFSRFVPWLLRHAPDLSLIRQAIPECLDHVMLEPMAGDRLTVVQHSIDLDICVLRQWQTLPRLRQMMKKDVFEACIIPSKNRCVIAIHVAIAIAHLHKMPLDANILKLLIPRSLAEVCGRYCLRFDQKWLWQYTDDLYAEEQTEEREHAVNEVLIVERLATQIWNDAIHKSAEGRKELKPTMDAPKVAEESRGSVTHPFEIQVVILPWYAGFQTKITSG